MIFCDAMVHMMQLQMHSQNRRSWEEDTRGAVCDSTPVPRCCLLPTALCPLGLERWRSSRRAQQAKQTASKKVGLSGRPARHSDS